MAKRIIAFVLAFFAAALLTVENASAAQVYTRSS